jgi:hypothetical protein
MSAYTKNVYLFNFINSRSDYIGKRLFRQGKDNDIKAGIMQIYSAKREEKHRKNTENLLQSLSQSIILYQYSLTRIFKEDFEE